MELKLTTAEKRDLQKMADECRSQGWAKTRSMTGLLKMKGLVEAQPSGAGQAKQWLLTEAGQAAWASLAFKPCGGQEEAVPGPGRYEESLGAVKPSARRYQAPTVPTFKTSQFGRVSKWG